MMDNPKRLVGRTIKSGGNKYTLVRYNPTTESFFVKDQNGKTYSFELAFVSHLLGLSYVKMTEANDG